MTTNVEEQPTAPESVPAPTNWRHESLMTNASHHAAFLAHGRAHGQTPENDERMATFKARFEQILSELGDDGTLKTKLEKEAAEKQTAFDSGRKWCR